MITALSSSPKKIRSWGNWVNHLPIPCPINTISQLTVSAKVSSLITIPLVYLVQQMEEIDLVSVTQITNSSYISWKCLHLLYNFSLVWGKHIMLFYNLLLLFHMVSSGFSSSWASLYVLTCTAECTCVPYDYIVEIWIHVENIIHNLHAPSSGLTLKCA